MTQTKLSDFTAASLTGEDHDLSAYDGQVALVVNTASKCGFTPQFKGLEKLYETYRDRGFVVLGFPCNQFANQDPGSAEEIGEYCERAFGVSFPMFEKVDVNGAKAHPIFKWLKRERGGVLGGAIKWNFTKFLIDREGRVIKRYGSATKPEQIAEDIEAAID